MIKNVKRWKNLNKKAFTLIELLAVIVILSVIALITTPIVLNLVDDAKRESEEISKGFYLKAVKQAILTKNLDKKFDPTTCIVVEDGNLQCDVGFLEVKTEGNAPTAGRLVLKNGEVISSVLIFDKEIAEEYYASGSDASIPDLYGYTLTPVIYDGENWIVADLTEEWYNYEKQEWANAVLLNNNVSRKTGDIVTVDGDNPDALAMFVWIPRYEYKIERTNASYGTSVASPGEIRINFISKDITSPQTGYIIHPAFTFGGEELSGIWVGKFETSYTTLSSSTTSNNWECSTEECESADGLRILPNVKALRYNNVSNYFFKSRSMGRIGNPFGILSSLTDSHMMKNSEWGAVAYLSQSKYGKYGNSNYVGTNKEIYVNISSSYITGSSNGTPSSSTTNTQCAYNDTTNNCGIGASTTGNIYGVYDMSGGAPEVVMGVYADSNGELYVGGRHYGGVDDLVSLSGFEGKLDPTYSGTDFVTGISFPNPKYYDVYKNINHQPYANYSYNTFTCNGDVCNGHALSETSGWYNDVASNITSWSPWMIRDDGIFGYTNSMGDTTSSGVGFSFRIVLTSAN